MKYNVEKITSTGTIYLVIHPLGREELLDEQALINNADCFAYTAGCEEVTNIQEAIMYMKEIGCDVYKLSNIKVEHLTR